jgi:hypothetical protein
MTATSAEEVAEVIRTGDQAALDWARSSEREKRGFVLIGKAAQSRFVAPEELSYRFRRAVAEPKPHDLRRGAAKHAEAVEVLVLGDQQAAVVDGQLSDAPVRYPDARQVTDVK